MDIKEIHAKVTAEIVAIEKEINERTSEITQLMDLNDVAQERILTLRKADKKINDALAELAELGPLMDSIVIKKKETKEKPRRTKLSKIIPAIVENAGASGITVEELVKFHYTNTNQELNIGSVRSLFYKYAHEGKYERLENGCWRVKQANNNVAA